MQRTIALTLFALLGTALAAPRPGSSEEDGMFEMHHAPFARAATPEGKEALKQIFTDKTLTRVQLEQKLDEWANKQGGDVATAYKAFKEKMATMETEIMQKIDASTLSANVKAAAKQMQQIYNDRALTVQEASEKIKAVLVALSAAEKKELKDFFKQLKPRKPRQAGPPGQGPDGGPMDRMKLPPFLGKATEEGRKAFKAILDNKNLNKQQFLDSVKAWASAQGEEIKKLVDETEQQVMEMKNMMKAKVASSTLSDAAKMAMNEMIAMFENMGLTLQQEAEQHKAIMEKQTEAVRKEMMQFLHENMKPMMMH